VDKLKCSDWDARFCSYDCKKEYQVVNNNNLRLNCQTGANDPTISWVSFWEIRELLSTSLSCTFPRSLYLSTTVYIHFAINFFEILFKRSRE